VFPSTGVKAGDLLLWGEFDLESESVKQDASRTSSSEVDVTPFETLQDFNTAKDSMADEARPAVIDWASFIDRSGDPEVLEEPCKGETEADLPVTKSDDGLVGDVLLFSLSELPLERSENGRCLSLGD